MEFTKTVQELQNLGSQVVRRGKRILKQKKKTTKSNTLYKGFDYLVTTSKDNIQLEFVFGGADDYWAFVDQGVKGAGGYKGSGKMRGGKTGFRFGSGNYSGKWQSFKSKIKKWIANKPIKLRGADGKFMEKTESNINSVAYLIQRAIYQRGLTRTMFFSKPYEDILDRNWDKVLQAYSEDVDAELSKNIKD